MFSLVTLIFDKGYTKNLNRLFALFGLFLSFWYATHAIHFFDDAAPNPLLNINANYVAVPFIAVLFHHFVSRLTNAKIFMTTVFYGASVLLTFGLILFKIPIVTSHIHFISAYNLLLFFFLLVCADSFRLLLKAFFKADGYHRELFLFLAMSSLAGFLGFAANLWIPFGLWIYPFNPYANIAVVLFFISVTFAALRNKLFDMDFFSQWMSTFGISVVFFLGLIGLVIYILEKIFSQLFVFGKGLPTLISIVLLFFLVDYIHRRLKNFVDRFIFDSPDFQSYVTKIETIVQKSDGIDSLSLNLATAIQDLMNLTHVNFMIWDISNSAFAQFPKPTTEEERVPHIFTKSDFLVRTLESERRIFKDGVLTRRELDLLIARTKAGSRVTFQKINRSLRWLNGAAAAPVMYKEQLMGFLVLGEKKNRIDFSREDRKLISFTTDLVAQKIKDLIITPAHPKPKGPPPAP